MSSWLLDFRQIVRRLLATPGFTCLAVLTLAVGIGANTAIFSLVEAVLLRPLPYPDSERLVGIWHSAPGIGLDQFELSEGTYLMYRDLNQSFDAIAAYSGRDVNLTGSGDPQRLVARTVTPDIFSVLGVGPAVGRGFTEVEGTPSGEKVAIASDRFARDRFGSPQQALGQEINLDGELHEIVGVLPADFSETFAQGRATSDLWLPRTIDPSSAFATSFNMVGIGRLKAGIGMAEARDDLVRIMERLPEFYPNEGLTPERLKDAQMDLRVYSAKADVVGDTASVLWILLGTVVIVLLVACGNVANLFLVRAEGRSRELAVRTALGASPASVVRFFLIESAALSFLAGVVGLGLAKAGMEWLSYLRPAGIPRLDELGLNITVVLFTLGITAFSSLLFGLFPALRSRVANLALALREGGRTASVGSGRMRARGLLILGQVALALVLLVGSVMLVRSFVRLQAVDPGFDATQTLTMRLSLPDSRYPTGREASSFTLRLLDDLKGLPGVEDAGAVSLLPIAGGGDRSSLFIEGISVPDTGIPYLPYYRYASPGYFRTQRVPILEGRAFTRADHEEATGAVIVSQALADKFWPNGDAIGRRVKRGEDAKAWYTIVGIAGSVRTLGLHDGPGETVYFPMVGLDPEEGYQVNRLSLVIRTQTSPSSLVTPVRDAIWNIDPNLPIANVQTMDDVVERSTARQSFTLIALAISAGVAVFLGAVGVYGVISYLVTLRTQEIGVRIALGASRTAVQGMVVRQGMGVVFLGVIAGLAGTLALSRFLETLLFEIAPNDPVSMAAGTILLVTVALVATYLPAHRASRLDPASALKAE